MQTLTESEIDALLQAINSTTDLPDFDPVPVVKEQTDKPTGRTFTQDEINELLRESYINPAYAESVDVYEFEDTEGKRYVRLSGVYHKEIIRRGESFWFTISCENEEG
ncbi:MAG: hypothetical protein LBL06_02615 [Treponema sp.]|jgi:hypothetical protein|nr:hypothetical protein [Treponema sp.]